jgi:sterol desaturase/sphingolipid hydroxylase (fatty acid hydroxylase superfamily)
VARTLAAIAVVSGAAHGGRVPRQILGAALGLGLVALIAVPIERRWPLHPAPVRRSGFCTDVAYWLGRPVLEIAGFAGAVVVALGAVGPIVPALLLRPLVTAQPDVLRVVQAFVLFDFVAYWTHRLAHEVPVFWRFHAVHHSSTHLDWLATTRTHPLDGVFAAIPVVVLVVAGYPVIAVAAALALVRGFGGLWAHLNVSWSARPLQRVMITPAFHHWHHALDRDAINHNYASFLPLWDLLFGTFFLPHDRHPSGYGIDEHVGEGLRAQLVYPFRSSR